MRDRNGACNTMLPAQAILGSSAGRLPSAPLCHSARPIDGPSELDTAILVKLVVREPDSTFYAQMVDGEIVWSSQIVVTECFSALLRKEREHGITASHRRRAWKQTEADIAARRLNLVTLTTETPA